MTRFTYRYFRGGEPLNAGCTDVDRASAQQVADVLLALPGHDGDEVHVWAGPTDVGEPAAVARI